MADSVWIEALLAKVEAGGYAVDPTPAPAADAVRVSERIWGSFMPRHNWENERDSTVSGTLLPVLPAKPRGRLIAYSVTVEPQPKGSAYAAVGDLYGFTALMRAAGLSATVATSGIDFAPVSAALESSTLYGYSGGNVYKLVGCRNRSRMIAEAGQPLSFAFEGQGLLRTDPAASAIPSATYLASEPPGIVSATLAIGSWSPDFQRAELDFGQDVVLIPSGNTADGLAAVKIARHRPRFRISVEQPAIATYDPYTIAEARTSQAITATFGSGTGFQVKIQSTTGYLLGEPRHVDLNGFTGYELEYVLTAASIRFD